MDAIKEYLRAVDRLEHGEINLGEYEKLCEPLRDVRKNVHGEWKNGVCNQCGFDWGKVVPIAGVPNYCPNCGVKMERREDG